MMSFHVVVARYSENIEWLRKFPLDSLYIYNKGDEGSLHTQLQLLRNGRDESYHVEQLPNIGREAHTYLHYIVQNYDKLPDIVHFTQGSLDEHPFHKSVDFTDSSKAFSTQNLSFCAFSNGFDRHCRLASYRDHVLEPAECNGHEWFYKYIDPFRTVNVQCMYIWWNAIFSVRKEFIQSRPRHYYKRLIEQLSTQNPEVAHYFERSWFYLFNCHKPNITNISEKCLLIQGTLGGLECQVIAERIATLSRRHVILLVPGEELVDNYSLPTQNVGVTTPWLQYMSKRYDPDLLHFNPSITVQFQTSHYTLEYQKSDHLESNRVHRITITETENICAREFVDRFNATILNAGNICVADIIKCTEEYTTLNAET